MASERHGRAFWLLTACRVTVGIHVRGGLARAKPHPILPLHPRERRSSEPSKLIWHGLYHTYYFRDTPLHASKY